MSEVQKSAEEAVVEKFDQAIEAKTAGLISEDKAAEMVAAAVAEVKASGDEALAEVKATATAQAEQLMDLEAKAAAPVVMKGTSDMIEFAKMDHNGASITGQTFVKRQGDNTDVPGGRVAGQGPFATREQANLFRGLATIIPAGGAGVVKLPSIAGITWASEAAQSATARSPGGSSTSKNVTVETWVSENEYSLANLQDVPGMDGAIVSLMAAQLGRAEGDDAVAVMKAATGLGNAQTTGLATALPTAANVIGVLADMRDGLASPYQNGSYVMSRAMYGRLTQSANNDLNFDPITGIARVFGNPVVVSDNLEATAAGNLVAVFADFSAGLALVDSSSMTIGRYDQTRPGSMTYFGHARFKNAIWDPAAISTLKVGA